MRNAEAIRLGSQAEHPILAPLGRRADRLP